MRRSLRLSVRSALTTRSHTSSKPATIPRMGSGAANLLWKFWYPLLTRLTRHAPVVFLNYGYAEEGADASAPALSAEDEPDRPCIQLYDAVVRPISLKGLRILEVSCGHGGGASYIARYFHPESMNAVDRNASAVALCQKRHAVSNLTFSTGNALALDFPNESFDAVVNVEASHCYPDVPRFLTEVARVLCPGGHFLYADFRLKTETDLLRRQLEQSGLQIVESEDISQNVVRGMQLNTEKYLKLINDLVPSFLRKPAMRFAGVPGSAIYEELVSGETVYMRYAAKNGMEPIVQAGQGVNA
jgi:ubiquinone/menaquinone biosynthesis C-methylase UbiE